MSPSETHILVVDDNEDNRDLLSRRLARAGYLTSIAADGESALARVYAGGVDLILLDVMMQGMSGLDVLKVIRETHSKIELPIIMATAKSDSEDVVEALGLGANDYVTKPLDFPVVLARVKAQLSLNREVGSRRGRTTVTPFGEIVSGVVLDDRYAIESVIGEGGCGIVYRARQLSTGQLVAVKLLRPTRLDPRTAALQEARFDREMRIIGKLSHPHVVRLVDAGRQRMTLSDQARTTRHSESKTDTFPGKPLPVQRNEQPAKERLIPYLVMEFLHGEPMDGYLDRKGLLDVELTTELMLPVLSAVEAAHAEGIVHRDLKPANIYLCRDEGGQPFPKVLDFGIAKPSIPEVGDLTGTGSFVGTPEYMSPEQARGSRHVDERADQYALGVILYECLTGRRPFHSDSFIELIHLIAKGRAMPLRTLRPDLPSDLEQIVKIAMAPNPDARFDSLHDLGHALLPFARSSIQGRWMSSFGPESVHPPTRLTELPPAGNT